MHQAMKLLARVTAIVGGLVLTGLVIMTSVSILGRSVNKWLHSDWVENTMGGIAQTLLDLGIGEVNGNYELLEAGIAFAIFSFFPACQLYSAHATVDIFTARLPGPVGRMIAAFWEVVLAAALILICVQLFGGVQRYLRNGETTLFLQFPVWWAYSASFAASVVTCVVAVYCAVMRVAESITGRAYLPAP